MTFASPRMPGAPCAGSAMLLTHVGLYLDNVPTTKTVIPSGVLMRSALDLFRDSNELPPRRLFVD